MGDVKRSLGKLRGRGEKGAEASEGEAGAEKEVGEMCNNTFCY